MQAAATGVVVDGGGGGAGGDANSNGVALAIVVIFTVAEMKLVMTIRTGGGDNRDGDVGSSQSSNHSFTIYKQDWRPINKQASHYTVLYSLLQ